jgi:sugar diacid utilization regulator
VAHTATGREQEVTVEMLLAEPLLQGELVAGGSAITNTVSWCLPLSEVSDRAWPAESGSTADLEGVVVHLSSAQLSNSDRARTLVSSLAKRGAAALVTWPGHDREPPSLDPAARAAETEPIPLISVPKSADFRRTSHLVASKVLAQTAHVLEYSVRVHRTLGEVFAHGSGVTAMARTMSQLSGTPVMVLGVDGELIAHADLRRAGVVEPATEGLADFALRVISEHRQERAQGAASGLAGTPHSKHLSFKVQDRMLQAVAAPVLVAGEAYGVVVLVETARSPDPHDLAQHAVIAEQGSTLVGSELLRQRAVAETEERARDDFVDTLLHGRFTDQHELAARARHYDFHPEGRYAVFVVTSPALQPGRTPGNQRAGDIVRSTGAVADGSLTLTALIGSMLVVVRELPGTSSKRGDALAEHDTRNDYAEQLRQLLHDRLDATVRVAHGRGGVGAAGVAKSYREARSAAVLAQRVGAAEVCGYDALRVFAALEEVATSTAGRSFADEVLAPLRRADGQTGNLEEIVLAYITESGNLNAAARRLHLHRNTMLYKLERASRALEMDIRAAETQFTVWLAHHIDTLSEVQTALDHELVPPT